MHVVVFIKWSDANPKFYNLLCGTVAGTLQTIFLPCQQASYQGLQMRTLGDWKARGRRDFFLPVCMLRLKVSFEQQYFALPDPASLHPFSSQAMLPFQKLELPLARTPAMNTQILKTPLPACPSHPQWQEPGPADGISSLPQSGVSVFLFRPPTTMSSILYLQFAFRNHLMLFLFSRQYPN